MNPISINGAVSAAPMLTFCSVSEKGEVRHYDGLFFEFLEFNGYRTVRNGSNLELVRIEGNVISTVDHIQIRHFVLGFVRKNMSNEAVDFYLSKNNLFSVFYLSSLATVEPKILRDTETSAYFFYQNGVVEVTKGGILDPVPYEQFGRLVWSSQIVPRNFKHVFDTSVFEKFCKLISNAKEDRFIHLRGLIGYMMHNYRTSANTRAVILNDENVSDEPEGGTGKSLVVKGIGKIRNVVERDGKKFDPTHEFAYASVDESTDILLLDDIKQGFKFEGLFSAITNGFNINRKQKDEYRLPVEKSPLVVITANTIIRGNSSSYKRRQYCVDIGKYFSANHTPIDEFGHTFFVDWDSAEWERFDSFMLACVKQYLAEGIVEAAESDHERKELIRSTCETFADWIEDSIEGLIGGRFNPTSQTKGEYLYQSGINAAIGDKKFIKWVKIYCKLKGLEFRSERKSEMRGFIILPMREEKNKSKSEHPVTSVKLF
ncbi:hypothetical protein [Mangrovibacterium lignilyticum]|uniref:hypothetical protein n=1 Tax=Mangrovibacterium lignilyticum TaxID=2668052 RepID=UPI0013D0189A|nr:hypothetical protein [Mangrovibacterium lignilyticum]